MAVPPTERGSYRLAGNIVRLKVPRSRRYFVATFFTPPLSKPPPRWYRPLFGPKFWPPGPPRAPTCSGRGRVFAQAHLRGAHPGAIRTVAKRRRCAKAELRRSLCSHHGGNIRTFVGGLPCLAETLATYSQHGNPVLTANLDACLAGLGAAQGE